MGDLIVCSNSLIYFLIFLLGPAVTGGERGLTSPHGHTAAGSEANGVSNIFSCMCSNKYCLVDNSTNPHVLNLGHSQQIWALLLVLFEGQCLDFLEFDDLVSNIILELQMTEKRKKVCVWVAYILCAPLSQLRCHATRASKKGSRRLHEVLQSLRRPLLGAPPGWKHLLALSHLRHYIKPTLTHGK